VPATDKAKPGVIYCLRQKGDATGGETVNPLQPYFLVYVLEQDRAIKYTFAQPKQILMLYRELCAGKTAPYEDLCAQFDQQTNNGAEMSRYNGLLQEAVRSIENTFQRRNIRNLLSGRGGVLVDETQQARATTDFDLITWLIIAECDNGNV
jgi:hypothetical protein